MIHATGIYDDLCWDFFWEEHENPVALGLDMDQASVI